MIFLIGSVLCGLSQNMTQLIAFRAVQGLGAGGLMVLAHGDHRRHRPAPRARPVPGAARRRLRASPASPARCSAASSPTTCPGAGSSTSTCRSASLALGRHQRRARTCRRAASSTASTGSGAGAARRRHQPRWCWSPPGAAPVRLGLRRRSSAWSRVGVALLVAFLLVERRAAEPIMPLGCSATASSPSPRAIGFIVGFAMFGAHHLPAAVPADRRTARPPPAPACACCR